MTYYTTAWDKYWGRSLSYLHPYSADQLYTDVHYGCAFSPHLTDLPVDYMVFRWSDGLSEHQCTKCWTRWRRFGNPGQGPHLHRCYRCRRREWLHRLLLRLSNQYGFDTNLIFMLLRFIVHGPNTMHHPGTITEVEGLGSLGKNEANMFMHLLPRADADWDPLTSRQRPWERYWSNAHQQAWLWWPIVDEDERHQRWPRWAAVALEPVGDEPAAFIVLSETQTLEYCVQCEAQGWFP